MKSSKLNEVNHLIFQLEFPVYLYPIIMSEQLRGEELGGRSYHMGMGLYRRLYAGRWRGGVKERLEGTGGGFQ